MKKHICITVLAVLISGCKTVDDYIGTGPITLSRELQHHFTTRYLTLPGPAYYVIPADGSGAYTSYCPSGAGTCHFDVVVLDSIRQCEKDKGQKCYILAEGERIVWKGPVTLR